MTADPALLLTIVVPVRDEAGSVAELAAEIDAAMAAAGIAFEVIWVDDGSTDGSATILGSLGAPHRTLTLARASGQSAALVEGFRAARAPWIGTLDGDGQNDPADLPRLLDHARRRGLDMVNGYRAERADPVVRRVSSRIANRARDLVLGERVRDVGCSTRVVRREALARIPFFDGAHRFLPALVRAGGFTIGEVPVAHRPRARGHSKYGIHDRLWRGLADLIGVRWLVSRSPRPR